MRSAQQAVELGFMYLQCELYFWNRRDVIINSCYFEIKNTLAVFSVSALLTLGLFLMSSVINVLLHYAITSCI